MNGEGIDESEMEAFLANEALQDDRAALIGLYFLPWKDIENSDIVDNEWMLQRTQGRSWVKLPRGSSITNVPVARKTLQALVAALQAL